MYKETLALLQSIPDSAKYRINTEKTTRYRLKLVEETTDLMELESKLGIGHLEEVLMQAQNELDLIPHLIEQEPWKTRDSANPVKIESID